MSRLCCISLSAALLLMPFTAQAGTNTWSGTGPFATGLGNQVITALAVSSDGANVYAGTGSGTVFGYLNASAPTATTVTATGITDTSATLPALVNANNATTTVTFEYGTTTGYGTTVTALPTSALGASINYYYPLSGLSTNTVYHFRVVATNGVGITNGLDSTFTTTALKLNQTIGAISLSPAPLVANGTATVSAAASSGLPITFTTNTGTVCTVSGTTVTGKRDGACTIIATQAGDGTYNSKEKEQIFTITAGVDPHFSVAPTNYLFGVESLVDCASNRTVPFTVTNNGATSQTLASLALGGVNADQFNLSSDTCSGQTIAAGGTCSVQVKFCPTTTGSKSALLNVFLPTRSAPAVAAMLHNHESTAEEAVRRLPAVLYSMNIPDTMNAGQSYTLTWSLLGYDESYQSIISFFNCTGISDGSCGNSYGSNFATSGYLDPIATGSGAWSFTEGTSAVTSKKFDYSYTFTAPATAQDIVIRFYGRSASDAATGNAGLSTLIPGNLSLGYYDQAGRRIIKHIR